MIDSFAFARTPRILFGAGKSADLPKLLNGYGGTVLLVTGHASYKTAVWEDMIAVFTRTGRPYAHVTLQGEPSPEFVDAAVARFGGGEIGVVVAWGGGSVVDAGKAISAMLPRGEAVVDYLEGVGTKKLPDGRKLPFVAVPTTAGTGSEATKNAVLSRIGAGGFKKSLRHDDFVPDLALIDPALALACPPEVTAACGMDAFTQLLEAYVSTAASPMTDALAWSGIECVARSLPRAVAEGDIAARTDMAYAALMSGVVLANAGLGVVHGLASPLGGYFDIPHGVVCGTLMGEAAAVTVARLRSETPGHPALTKYARVGELLSGKELLGTPRDADRLIEALAAWTERFKIPRLSVYGLQRADLPRIAGEAENKNNPVELSTQEILGILERRY